MRRLKGADAAVAGVLVAAAAQSGCDLHLALVSIEESGAAEYADHTARAAAAGPSRIFEAGEVDRTACDAVRMAAARWQPSALGKLPFEDEELSPPDAFDDMEPDEEEFHEATGNEGATFERTYSRAALVLWPRERSFAVLNQAGLPVTLPYLDDLAQRWAASGEDRHSPLWRQAHELAGHMLSGWPTQRWYPQYGDKPSDVARMLDPADPAGGHAQRIDAFLAASPRGGHYDKGDNDAVIGRARAVLGRAACGFDRTHRYRDGRDVARRLRRSAEPCHGGTGRRARRTSGAVTALVDALPGDPSRAPKIEPWQRPRSLEPGFVVDLFTALGRFDKAMAQRAADDVLARPATYGLDSVLVPAVRD